MENVYFFIEISIWNVLSITRPPITREEGGDLIRVKDSFGEV
ncbi:uncharacterized protein FFNC_15716 [Fusarium fujikuroi]|nr:uncharacterized protein FFNC_15716 [Fusarium fujikuroi]